MPLEHPSPPLRPTGRVGRVLTPALRIRHPSASRPAHVPPAAPPLPPALHFPTSLAASPSFATGPGDRPFD